MKKGLLSEKSPSSPSSQVPCLRLLPPRLALKWFSRNRGSLDAFATVVLTFAFPALLAFVAFVLVLALALGGAFPIPSLF